MNCLYSIFEIKAVGSLWNMSVQFRRKIQILQIDTHCLLFGNRNWKRNEYYAGFLFQNTSPRPDGKRPGAQAVAFRAGADKQAYYNCRFIGFQDTLLDDDGRHFFKD